jgi:hypothetical protein
MLNINCRVGDLAITVQAYNSDNIGKIVRIIRSKGIGPWPDLVGPQQIWEIESATPGVALIYSINDVPFLAQEGEAPDCFLRPIRPSSAEQTSENHQEEELEYV